MRGGIILSALGHVVLLLWGLLVFADPRPFAAVNADSITVDIVAPNEVPESREPPSPEVKTPVAEDPKTPDRLENTASISPPRPLQPQSERQQPQLQRPQQPQLQRQEQPQPPTPTQAGEEQPQPKVFVFSPTVAPVPEVPLLPGATSTPIGFEPPADSVAGLSSGETAALKAHLQKCWTPPPGLDGQRLKVVLRVTLKSDGAMRAQPMLLEASASPYGPALVETASRALRQCQPYSFLPSAKYQEWKVLDLKFSPQGMGG